MEMRAADMAIEPDSPWLDQVFCEDALAGLARIPDGSVDLILTDPPYNLARITAMRPTSKRWKSTCAGPSGGSMRRCPS
jgi:DNA modification methylase